MSACDPGMCDYTLSNDQTPTLSSFNFDSAANTLTVSLTAGTGDAPTTDNISIDFAGN
jgi:hypothetical protein